MPSLRAPRRLLPLLLAACATAPVPAPEFVAALADVPPHSEARLEFADGELVAVAAPLPPDLLPPSVRTALLAVAPDGEITFAGVEWGTRGRGYRVEKVYAEPLHRRSVLVDGDGVVLERAHTVPMPEVPQDVLATAATKAPRVEEAWIVSGPHHEEHWSLLVRERSGAAHLLRIGLDGRLVRAARRVAARVDG